MLSVLVVDRESDVRGLLETILKRMGHRVKPQDFLDNNDADSEEYNLVILDMGSIEHDNKLLDASTRRSKLCLSSVWNESKLSSDTGVEYDFFLQKPFRVDSLRKIIEAVQKLNS